IDEVSMVRCDLLDVIDAILRAVRKNNAPFGRVQLLLIGDLYQLPPVSKREEWSFLRNVYPSPYFFDAIVIRNNPLLQVELTEVFRQTEPEFISILNAIRNNQISQESLDILNQRHQPTFTATEDLNPIIITSHNVEANSINKKKLDDLAGMEYTFDGEISGDFRDLGMQAEQSLKIKEGAQVMFIKNDTGDDRKFYNGKIGKIKSIRNTEIWVSFPHEEDLLLEKSSWQSFEYKTDTEEAIVQQQVGEFSQYPIKLAWAVTIHKSQGLTFDHAIIDAGKSFVAGQVYVALSRVRTLNGLILQSKINTESLRSNVEVINYMRPASIAQMDDLLVQAQEKYILDLVLSHFTLLSLAVGLETISANTEIQKANIPEVKALITQLDKAIKDLINVSNKFQVQIRQLHSQKGFAELESLQSRIESALNYFSKEMTLQLLNAVNKNIRVKPKNKIQQQIQHMLLKYRNIIEHKISVMQMGSSLLKSPIDKQNYKSWITEQKEKSRTKPGAAHSAQQNTSLQLF
ncbi:MAG: helicase, partial [Pedobacter sp.]